MKKNIVKVKRKDLETTIQNLINESLKEMNKENKGVVINISDFPEYDEHPSNGSTPYSDSHEFELEFEKDGIQYYVTTDVRIKGTRYHSPQTQEQPEENGFSLERFGINIISGEKYTEETETELSDEEKMELTSYLGEYLEIVE